MEGAADVPCLADLVAHVTSVDGYLALSVASAFFSFFFFSFLFIHLHLFSS